MRELHKAMGRAGKSKKEPSEERLRHTESEPMVKQDLLKCCLNNLLWPKINYPSRGLYLSIISFSIILIMSCTDQTSLKLLLLLSKIILNNDNFL